MVVTYTDKLMAEIIIIITCNNLSIRTPIFKPQIFKNKKFGHGIKIWNKLFPEIKSITNENKFKNILRKAD